MKEESTTDKNPSEPERPTPQFYDMIVFCHLRWQFVYQRPQHIVSRLAVSRKVLFIEEPIFHHDNDGKSANLQIITDTLHVLQPRVNSISEIAALLPSYISNDKVELGWFYSASFVTLLKALKFDTIIYDCMDELTLFKNAPLELIELEKELLSKADVVFTGGKSLYESKSMLHKNVSCFPSSVDREHFAKASNGIDLPQDIAGIPPPIVGYFGVIDERLDFDLISKVACLRPNISFVMIGPLAKVTAEELPRNTNIFYLGMKEYAMLPGYLKAFSIAMMPFALNDATKFISPTKTLEYMAAGKPIISTPVKDVVRDYSGTVKIVNNPSEFIQAVDTILLDKDRLSMDLVYKNILEKTSWNNTVSQMEKILKSSKS